MNQLKKLFQDLNPQIQLSEDNWPESFKEQSESIKHSFFRSIKENEELLLEIVLSPENRNLFKQMFSIEELYWAFLREKLQRKNWFTFLDAMIENDEGQLLIDNGFFDNGLPSASEEVPPRVKNFIIQNPEYFTWQYLSDSFIEQYDAAHRLLYYGIEEYFHALVIPKSTGAEVYTFIKKTNPKKLFELTAEQKIEVFTLYFKESKSDKKFAFWESNQPLSLSLHELFFEIKDNLSRETVLSYYVFMLDVMSNSPEALARVSKKIIKEFSPEEIKEFYAAQSEIGVDFRRGRYKTTKDKKNIPEALQETIQELEDEKERVAIKEGRFEETRNLALFKGKRIPLKDKIAMGKAYLVNCSEDYFKIRNLGEFFKEKEKKSFFLELKLTNLEAAQEFLEDNFEELDLPLDEVVALLSPRELISKLTNENIISLVKSGKIPVADVLDSGVLSQFNVNHELLAQLAQTGLITNEMWLRITEGNLNAKWVPFIPEEVLAKIWEEKSEHSEPELLAHPSLSSEQRKLIIQNTSRYNYSALINQNLTSEEFSFLFNKLKDISLKDSKETLSKLLSKDLSEDIKKEICERLIKASDAFTLLMPYSDLLDEKTKSKLITASLKNKDEVVSLLIDEETPVALRQRALVALVKFDKELKSYIQSTERLDDLSFIKDLVIEKNLKHSFWSLVQSKVSGKKSLITHFKMTDTMHNVDISSLGENLTADEMTELVSHYGSYHAFNLISKLPKEKVLEMSKLDSPGAVFCYGILDQPFPDTLIKYVGADSKSAELFKKLSPGNRPNLLVKIAESVVDEMSREISKEFTLDEWPIVISLGKARWHSFYEFLTDKKQPVAWVKAQFELISQEETLWDSFNKEISNYELNKITEIYPSLKKLNEKITTATSSSEIYLLTFTSLVMSAYTEAQIEAAEVRDKRINSGEETVLLELLKLQPARTISLMVKLLESTELTLSHLEALAPMMKEYHLEEFLIPLFLNKRQRITASTPKLFSPSDFSEEQQIEIAEQLARSIRSEELGTKIEWIWEFIRPELIPTEVLIRHGRILNYFIKEKNREDIVPRIEEYLSNNEVDSFFIRRISDQFEINSLLGKKIIQILIDQKKMELFSLSATGPDFSIMLVDDVVYDEKDGEKTSSLLTPEQEVLILAHFKKEINLPAELAGVFSTLTLEFIPSDKCPKKYLKNLKFLRTNQLIEEQLEELNEAGIDLNLSATAYRKIKTGDKWEADSFYSIGLNLKESFVPPVNEELESLLVTQQGIFSQLEELAHNLPLSNRRWGFELEFSSSRPRTKLAPEFGKDDFNVHVANNYHKSQGATWDFKQDTSLDSVNGGFTIEIASPILVGKDGVDEARRFLNKLFNSTKVITGEESNSGLHVHHEVIDIINGKEQIQSLLSILSIYQEPIFALCAPYRQNNDYCLKIYGKRLSEIDSWNNRDGFNFSDRGTLEFRMREALDNTETIIRWIKLTQKVVEDLVLKVKGENTSFQEQVLQTIELIEHEKMRQLSSANSLEGLDHFLLAKEFSKTLLSSKNRA